MAVAQDAAAIFAIKQTNEKISTNKHKAQVRTKKQKGYYSTFCYIFTYLLPYICLYLSDTEKI